MIVHYQFTRHTNSTITLKQHTTHSLVSQVIQYKFMGYPL